MNRNLYIKSRKSSGVWSRPTDWLTISAGTNQIVGLFLIFEDQYNFIVTRNVGGTGTVDFGDGSGVQILPTTFIRHDYDYSAISQTPITFEGRTCKQAVVTFTFTSNNSFPGFTIADNATEPNANGIINFVDLEYNCTSLVRSRLSTSERRLSILQRFEIKCVGTTSGFHVDEFQYVRSLKEFKLSTANARIHRGNFSNSLLPFHEVYNLDLLNIQASFSNLTNPDRVFSLGNISNYRQAFQGSRFANLGIITVVDNSAFSEHFQNISAIKIERVIIPPLKYNNSLAGQTGVRRWFENARVEELELFGQSGDIINTTGAMRCFLNCTTIRKLTLPNSTVGWDLRDMNMDEDALIDLANSVDTYGGVGVDIFILTGNPGAGSTAYQTILTDKYYTVIP